MFFLKEDGLHCFGRVVGCLNFLLSRIYSRVKMLELKHGPS